MMVIIIIIIIKSEKILVARYLWEMLILISLVMSWQRPKSPRICLVKTSSRLQAAFVIG